MLPKSIAIMEEANSSYTFIDTFIKDQLYLDSRECQFLEHICNSDSNNNTNMFILLILNEFECKNIRRMKIT